MTKEVMTANKAVAEAVRLAKPQVIPVYPITPQTTISEYLAQYVADERINAKYVKVESEHSAISAAVGASGAGVYGVPILNAMDILERGIEHL